ncbi:MAG: hypothetical protein AABX44_01485 [Nanoarchaeota archaeon]
MRKIKNLKNKLKNSAIFGLSFVTFGLGYPISTNGKLEKHYKKPWNIEFAEHFEKLNNYKHLEKQEIDSAFSFLNPGLREYIKKVYFVKKEDLFCKNALAEAHSLEDMNIICLTDSSKETIFHESAHIRQNGLDRINSDFSKKWKQIANFEYGIENVESLFLKDGTLLDRRWKDDSSKCPKDGLLNPYSAKSINEDIAEFVGTLGNVDKKERAKNLNCQNMIYQLFFCDTTDRRYQKKLDLLKEYNFLTKEEHKKLSENLGCLNYLLK